MNESQLKARCLSCRMIKLLSVCVCVCVCVEKKLYVLMVMLTKIKVFWIIALSFAKHRVLNFAASLHRKPASSRTSLDSCRAQQ